MLQVQLFGDSDWNVVQQQMNDFLAGKPAIKIVDISLQVNVSTEPSGHWYVGMIIYRS